MHENVTGAATEITTVANNNNYQLTVSEIESDLDKAEVNKYEQILKNNEVKLIESLNKFITTTKPLIFFIIGAIVGALITDALQFNALIISIGIMFILSLYYALLH